MSEWNFNFEKLQVWQKARELSKEVYACTRSFPASEQFGLVSQMRRAAVSVSSNIAEGMSRTSVREQIRFIEVAYGSLMELFCQIRLAGDFAFIAEVNVENFRVRIREIAAMLSGLRKSIVHRSEEDSNP
ncbi:MAG: four helix bundle protein [Opitutales bacterium]|nr:four helix bundle protein [Opitutales bacterium]